MDNNQDKHNPIDVMETPVFQLNFLSQVNDCGQSWGVPSEFVQSKEQQKGTPLELLIQENLKLREEINILFQFFSNYNKNMKESNNKNYKDYSQQFQSQIINPYQESFINNSQFIQTLPLIQNCEDDQKISNKVMKEQDQLDFQTEFGIMKTEVYKEFKANIMFQQEIIKKQEKEIQYLTQQLILIETEYQKLLQSNKPLQQEQNIAGQQSNFQQFSNIQNQKISEIQNMLKKNEQRDSRNISQKFKVFQNRLSKLTNKQHAEEETSTIIYNDDPQDIIPQNLSDSLNSIAQQSCMRCTEEINGSTILTNCLHYFDQRCFDEMIGQQIIYQNKPQILCLCKKKLDYKILVQVSLSKQDLFRRQLYENQLNLLKLQLKNQNLIVQCSNNNCNFFYINLTRQQAKQFKCFECQK